MELCLSGADSYLIQIFKWTIETWELIAANSLFHAVFTTLATFPSNKGYAEGRNLKHPSLTGNYF